MSTRGSKISRVIAYFKEAEIEEARIVFVRVEDIVAARSAEEMPKAKSKRRRRRASQPQEVANVNKEN